MTATWPRERTPHDNECSTACQASSMRSSADLLLFEAVLPLLVLSTCPSASASSGKENANFEAWFALLLCLSPVHESAHSFIYRTCPLPRSSKCNKAAYLLPFFEDLVCLLHTG